MQELKTMLKDYMVQNVTEGTYVVAFEKSDELGLPELKEKVLRYAVENWKEVEESADYAGLSKDFHHEVIVYMLKNKNKKK